MSTLASVILKGVFASLPAAGIPGRLYFTTDTLATYRDNGTTWDNVSNSSAPTGTAGGDLSGTYPNPTVAQVNGAVVPASAVLVGTNSSRQLIANTTTASQSGVQQEAYVYAADTGAANAYAVTLSPVPTIVAGSVVSFKAANANTAASTLTVNGTSYPMTKNGTTALAGGEIAANQIVTAKCDGTNFQITVGSSGGGTVTAVTGTAPIASSGGTTPAISVGTATTGALGVVKPDGTTVTVSSGTISVPTATTGALGLVKPDGTTVAVSSGVISIPTATTGALGLVKPDGTTITVASGVISAAAAASNAFPFTVYQEGFFQSGASNVSSLVVTFPEALAASGATAFMLIGCDGSSTVTIPSGWTSDINQQQSTYARLILCHKASAGDTSATITVAAASSFSVYFFELAGTRSLDQSSSSGVANTNDLTLPAITPTAGSAVFSFCSFVSSAANLYTYFIAAFGGALQWLPVGVGTGSTTGRCLAGWIGKQPARNVATQPPVLHLYSSSGSAAGLFSSGGIAYSTFSIK